MATERLRVTINTKEFRYISNILSLFRIFLLPFIVFGLTKRTEFYKIFTLSLMIVSMISDALDGYLARKLNEVSALGKMLDPIGDKISIATVYRTVRLFEEANILERHDFGDGRSRYEEAGEDHHDHLIDIQSGRVIEFRSPEIELLQRQIAEQHGFRLVGHRLELYGVPLDAAHPEKA